MGNIAELKVAEKLSDEKVEKLTFKSSNHTIAIGYKKGYKLYNFRRPDKFSKDHLRALQDIHKEFSRQYSLILAAYLRMPIEISIISLIFGKICSLKLI